MTFQRDKSHINSFLAYPAEHSVNNPYHQKLFCVKHTTNRIMIQKIGQGKPWRWVVISAGVVLGGYLLISLLGAILGLAFAAGTLLGGAWLFQRIWNQWKTRQIDESSNPPKKEDQNLEAELANLKAKMKPNSED